MCIDYTYTCLDISYIHTIDKYVNRNICNAYVQYSVVDLQRLATLQDVNSLADRCRLDIYICTDLYFCHVQNLASVNSLIASCMSVCCQMLVRVYDSLRVMRVYANIHKICFVLYCETRQNNLINRISNLVHL